MKPSREGLSQFIIYVASNLAFVLMLVVVVIVVLTNRTFITSDTLALVAVFLAVIAILPTIRYPKPDQDMQEVKELLRRIADKMDRLPPAP